MGVKAAVFQSGGQASQHFIPGAYSRIDFQRSAGGLSSINNAVIMGDSRGGQPNELLWFSSPSEAEAVLRSGPLLDAIKHAFSPGGGYVPQRISALRVNPGAQASKNFLKTADAVIIAKAWDWGLHGNQVKVKLENGTSSGKKLTIQFMSETAYVVDNIGKSSFSIDYTGAEVSCTMTITSTSLTTTTATHTQELDITLANFPTVQDLVNYINDQAGYSCSVLSLTPSTDLSTELDWVTAVNINDASPYAAYSNVSALIEAMEDCPWIYSAEYNVTASGRVLPDNIATWAYFTGGTDGTYTTSEWTDSLEYLETQDIQFIGASSSDAGVHALISAHVDSMNSVTGRSERQAILGGASGETVAQVIARAEALNSMAVMLVYPEFQDWNAQNTAVVWWGPAYYAAKLIGLTTCLPLNEPLTNKVMSVLNFKTLTNSELEQLIQGGVCAGYKNPLGLFVNVRQVTTYQGSELQKCEFSMVREALYVVRDLRNNVEQTFVGRAMTNSLLTDIDATVNLKLAQYAALGLFNGDPLYWGYLRRVNGDQIIIEFNCHLTPPTNFIFITSHMAVYASVAA
jgi:hypothetical protein